MAVAEADGIPYVLGVSPETTVSGPLVTAALDSGCGVLVFDAGAGALTVYEGAETGLTAVEVLEILGPLPFFDHISLPVSIRGWFGFLSGRIMRMECALRILVPGPLTPLESGEVFLKDKALSNERLRCHGFLMPSDLAGC